jgi:hypothetical protein
VNPRGGKVSNQTGRKDEPGSHRILMTARGDETVRLDTGEPTGIEREYEIDVVDHVVEHDAHVERSKRKRRQPRRFHCQDSPALLDGHPPSGIEPLHVPHGDDTTVPVLAKGKTDTGRCWVYVRDDKPFGGAGPPAAMFYYSRDRKGEHPQALAVLTHLQAGSGAPELLGFYA